MTAKLPTFIVNYNDGCQNDEILAPVTTADKFGQLPFFKADI